MAKFSDVTSTLRPLPPWYERPPPAVQPRVIAKAAAQNKELEAALEKLGADIIRLRASHVRLLNAAELALWVCGETNQTLASQLRGAIAQAKETAP